MILRVLILLILCFSISCIIPFDKRKSAIKINHILLGKKLIQKDLMRAKYLFCVGKNNAAKLILNNIIKDVPNSKESIDAFKLLLFVKKKVSIIDNAFCENEKNLLVVNLKKINDKKFDLTNNSFKLFEKKLQIYEKSKNYYEKFNFEKVLLKIISKKLSINDLMIVLSLKEHPIFVECAAITLIQKYLKQNKLINAENILKKYLLIFSSKKIEKQIDNFANRIKILKEINLKTIGIILPLSGKYAFYGKRVLSAIQFALGLPQYINNVSSIFIQKIDGIKIVVGDSNGKYVKVLKIVDKFIKQYNAFIILGGLTAENSLSIAENAQKYAVPVILLSRVSKITKLGSYVLRIGLTPEKQARALAKYAVNNLWINRFAILYPRHKYGIEMMKYFWDEVEKQGAEVKAVESYDHNQTTFTTEIKKMVGTYYLDARLEYLFCKKKVNKSKNLKEKKRIVEKCKNKLLPIVDFEALFIPDFSKTVSYIIPALVSEDILISQNDHIKNIFKSVTSREEEPLQLLGGNGWNSHILGKRIGRQLDGALFVDGFNGNSKNFKSNYFVNKFLKLHNSLPSLIEIQSYDIALAVKNILIKNGIQIKSGKGFLKKILNKNIFNGVCGSFYFTDNGESLSNLYWFRFDNSKIKAIPILESIVLENDNK